MNILNKLTLWVTVLGMLTLSFFSPHLSAAGESRVITKEVSYYQGQEDVTGYLARPNDNQQHPAIILIHEWWGLNDWIKENARKFASLGYVALAVDLYNGEAATSRDQARKLATHVRSNMDEAFKNLEQAIAFLKGQTRHVIPTRLGSIGWCFGGGWSYQMAKNNLGVKASVIYYGFFNPKDDLGKMRATIIGNFAEKDRGIRVDNVREFQAKLKTLSGDHEIYIYANTGHAFANPVSGNYDKAAAELAWKRTITFLEKYL